MDSVGDTLRLSGTEFEQLLEVVTARLLERARTPARDDPVQQDGDAHVLVVTEAARLRALSRWYRGRPAQPPHG